MQDLKNNKYRMIEIMLDLETMSVNDYPVITQLAAVAFCLNTGKTLDSFNEHIGIRDSVQQGLTVDGKTFEWWCKQPVAAYNDVVLKSMYSDSKIQDVLVKFTVWIDDLKIKYGAFDKKTTLCLWGNGISADNRWLMQAYTVCKLEPPWQYYENRDVRTLVDLGRRVADFDIKMVGFVGTKHNALDDCNHQIKYCYEIFTRLRNISSFVHK